jgi:hypothetical protein
MPEHQIRLRRGWRCFKSDGPSDVPDSDSGLEIALPVTWPARAGPEEAVRLVRSFTAPTIDPPRECVSLRLSAVVGLVSVQLNGQELARPTPGTTALELHLRDPLPRRNRLVLDVLLQAAGPFDGHAPPAWGFIALVIERSAAPSDDASAGAVDESLGGSDVPE